MGKRVQSQPWREIQSKIGKITIEFWSGASLGPFQVFMINFYCEKSQQLKDIEHFDNKTSLSGAQLVVGMGESLSCLFFKIERNCPDFRNKCPDCVHLWIHLEFLISFLICVHLEFLISNAVLRGSRRKKVISMRSFFLHVLQIKCLS